VLLNVKPEKFIEPSVLPTHDQSCGIDLVRVEGRLKASHIKKIEEMVERHPHKSLSIVRNWLHQDG
jgi:flagellar biosynthesis/type III secretory pathway M-ring protein FliF/YscJ